MKRSIVVVGSSNTDMVISADRLPAPGETILGGTFFMNAGGKGANQAVAAARLGAEVCFIAKTGNDIFGRQAVKLFREEGIDISYMVSDSDGPSGVALIMVDKQGENCIVVASGANATLSPQDLRAAEEVLGSAGCILLQLEVPLATVEYVANLRGAKSVIITLGAEGAVLLYDQGLVHVPAIPVKAVDTTAAGDVFNGALAAALSEGRPLLEATRYACRAAAFSVTKRGALVSAPRKHELAMFVFSAGILASNLIFNTLLIKKPFSGVPTSYAAYWKGNFKTHLTGIAGGLIWGLGNSFNLIAAGKAGPAISYGLGQGATLIAALWGVFVWKEFRSSPPATYHYLGVMFVVFIAWLGCIIYAGQ